jgi:hypothetical protein
MGQAQRLIQLTNHTHVVSHGPGYTESTEPITLQTADATCGHGHSHLENHIIVMDNVALTKES